MSNSKIITCRFCRYCRFQTVKTDNNDISDTCRFYNLGEFRTLMLNRFDSFVLEVPKYKTGQFLRIYQPF